jgi:hypothetical protein
MNNFDEFMMRRCAVSDETGKTVLVGQFSSLQK